MSKHLEQSFSKEGRPISFYLVASASVKSYDVE